MKLPERALVEKQKPHMNMREISTNVQEKILGRPLVEKQPSHFFMQDISTRNQGMILGMLHACPQKMSFMRMMTVKVDMTVTIQHISMHCM